MHAYAAAGTARTATSLSPPRFFSRRQSIPTIFVLQRTPALPCSLCVVPTPHLCADITSEHGHSAAFTTADHGSLTLRVPSQVRRSGHSPRYHARRRENGARGTSSFTGPLQHALAGDDIDNSDPRQPDLYARSHAPSRSWRASCRGRFTLDIPYVRLYHSRVSFNIHPSVCRPRVPAVNIWRRPVSGVRYRSDRFCHMRRRSRMRDSAHEEEEGNRLSVSFRTLY